MTHLRLTVMVVLMFLLAVNAAILHVHVRVASCPVPSDDFRNAQSIVVVAAGLAIVLLGIMLDRITQSAAARVGRQPAAAH